MFIDLTETKIINEEIIDDDNFDGEIQNISQLDSNISSIHYLTSDKFVVVKSAKTEKTTHHDTVKVLTKQHYVSKISYWVSLENEYRIIPVNALHGPAYVVDTIPLQESDIKDGTALVVKPKDQWLNALFQNNDTD